MLVNLLRLLLSSRLNTVTIKEKIKGSNILCFIIYITFLPLVYSCSGDNPLNTSPVNLYLNRGVSVEQGVITKFFVVGTDGVLLSKSSDKVEWEKRQLVAGIDLLDIQFLDASNGYILAEKSGYFSTNNSGDSWLFNQIKINSSFTSIFFSDKQRGWVTSSDGKVFSTSDSGKTWSIIPIWNGEQKQYYFSDILFDTQGNGIIVGATDLSNQEPVVLSSADWGTTWVELNPDILNLNQLNGISRIKVVNKEYYLISDFGIVKTTELRDLVFEKVFFVPTSSITGKQEFVITSLVQDSTNLFITGIKGFNLGVIYKLPIGQSGGISEQVDSHLLDCLYDQTSSKVYFIGGYPYVIYEKTSNGLAKHEF